MLGDIDKVNLPVSENDQYIVVNEDDDTISIENQENMPAYTLSQLVGKAIRSLTSGDVSMYSAIYSELCGRLRFNGIEY